MISIKQTIKNTSSGWLSIIVKSIFSIITIPFLLKSLGTDGYGLITILGTIVALSSSIDLGLRSALGQTLSEQLALKRKKRFSVIISNAFVLYILISLFLAILIYFMAPSIATVLNVSKNINLIGIQAIQLYGCLAILISFITPVFSAGLNSYQRFDIVNTISTITSILTNCLILGMIKFTSFSVLDWVMITLLFQFLGLTLLIVAFNKCCDGIKLSLKYLNFNELSPLFSIGKYMYIIQLSGTISNSSNPLIISSFLNVKSLGLYNPALSISTALTPIVMTLTNQLYPAVTNNNVTGNQEGINKIFLYGGKYTFLLGSLAAAGVFFFAEPFTKLWLSNSIGDDYLIVSELIRIFVIIDILSYSSGTQWPILLGMKKLKYLTRVLVSTAILDIGISIYFVSYLDYGISGVLYGTIVSKVIRVYLLNKYILNLLNIKFMEYFKISIIIPILSFILISFTAWIITINFNCHTWGDFLLMSGSTVIIWFIYTWFLFLTTNEKKLITKGNFRSLSI